MTGQIRKNQKRAVDAWLSKHNPKCPICLGTSWDINNTLQGLPSITGDRTSGKVNPEKNLFVAFSIVCKNCGALQLFSAAKAGAF